MGKPISTPDAPITELTGLPAFTRSAAYQIQADLIDAARKFRLVKAALIAAVLGELASDHPEEVERMRAAMAHDVDPNRPNVESSLSLRAGLIMAGLHLLSERYPIEAARLRDARQHRPFRGE
jgi:hypothetical protein